MLNNTIKKKLSEIFDERARFNCIMKEYTTFAIGGEADVVVEVKNEYELQQLFEIIENENLAWRILGKGSNVLVKDTGFKGVIIRLAGDFLSVSAECIEDEVIVSAGCGLTLTKLVKWCQLKGYGGAEFLFGIPGSLGGAAWMNAGAWGMEISSLVKKIILFDGQGIVEIEREDLDFQYRKCITLQRLKKSPIILSVQLSLEKDAPAEILRRCREYVAKRLSKQPKGMPNAGSFFRNPVGDSAGRLIDICGLKGFCVGDAMVSEVHANFLVNRGHATAHDVHRLMETVQQRVLENCGVELQPEVHFI